MYGGEGEDDEEDGVERVGREELGQWVVDRAFGGQESTRLQSPFPTLSLSPQSSFWQLDFGDS